MNKDKTIIEISADGLYAMDASYRYWDDNLGKPFGYSFQCDKCGTITNSGWQSQSPQRGVTHFKFCNDCAEVHQLKKD